jgi:probable HAF family extracellular repeat protein
MKKYCAAFLAVVLIVMQFAGCGGGGGGGGTGNPPSNAKAITAFSFTSPAATGTVDENAKTISVTVPFNTNVAALVANFVTTGTLITVGSTVQVSGMTSNNFTNPVAYVVTAADSSTATYTATVTIAPNSAKAVTAFSFASPAATGTINEAAKTISVTVPFDTNVTSLIATFSTTGALVTVGSVTQVSGVTANNFTNPVAYVVTAADSSTATYTATVTIAPNSAKAVTAFSFASPAATGTINEAAKTISVTVPFGTNVTSLIATFSTTGALVTVGSVTQVSGVTANNFTNPVAYVVTAADSSTVTYTVTVTIAPSSAKAITAFSFMSPSATGIINESAKTVALTVPAGTDVTALVATFSTTGALVSVGLVTQVTGSTPNDFTNPVAYVVTAADASTVTYTVRVTIGSKWLDLGTLGGASSYAFGASADGSVVVGYAKNSDSRSFGFRWTNAGGMVSLGTLCDDPSSYGSMAYGISADGSVITGLTHYCFTIGGTVYSSDRAFAWTQGGGMTNLGNLHLFDDQNYGAWDSYATGISADGNTEVGIAWNGATVENRVVRWNSGSILDIVQANIVAASPNGFNASSDGSVVAGTMYDAGSNARAFRWTQASDIVSLGTFSGGHFSVANNISADGTVIVGCADDALGATHAFRWTQASGMVDLGTLPGDTTSNAFGVSSDGSVVVGASSPGPHAYRWTAATGMQSINDWLASGGVDATGVAFAIARGVSGDGKTVVGDTSALNPHAFSAHVGAEP